MTEPGPEQRPFGPRPWASEGDALRCSRSDRNGSAVVQVVGEVDWATAPILREALAPVMTAASPKLIVDLSGVTFLDSSGLSVLIRAHHHVRNRGGRLRLAGPRPAIRKILHMTDADRVLAVYETLEAALDEDGQPATTGPEQPKPLSPAYGLEDWLRRTWDGVSPINLN